MSKLNWFRVLLVAVIFALYWGLSPEWLKGFWLGLVLMMIVVKIEEQK